MNAINHFFSNLQGSFIINLSVFMAPFTFINALLNIIFKFNTFKL